VDEEDASQDVSLLMHLSHQDASRRFLASSLLRRLSPRISLDVSLLMYLSRQDAGRQGRCLDKRDEVQNAFCSTWTSKVA